MKRVLKHLTAVLSLGVALSAVSATQSFAQLKDGAITIALSGGLDRLDPAKTSNGPDLMILGQIYDTLLRMSPTRNHGPLPLRTPGASSCARMSSSATVLP
jgi:peptide/nickel transport system substrate-binding protein